MSYGPVAAALYSLLAVLVPVDLGLPGDDGRASPRVINGVVTADYPTTGSLLTGNNPGDAFSICTGTLIGCETFLTAAHCVCMATGADCQGAGAPDPSDYFVYLQHAGIVAVSDVLVHPSYAFPVADVAIVKLAATVSGIDPTPINTVGSPPIGTPATIVGFGVPDAAGASGIKRTGQVTTAPCTAGISNTTSVCWNFANPVGPAGSDSNTCFGDSGGPLYADAGQGLLVAGITSGGLSGDCQADDVSFDANVFFYRDVIQAAGGPDVGASACGSLPAVGELGTVVVPFSGALDATNAIDVHVVDVSPNTAELRVTLNGIDDLSDFDLRVRQGAPPTPTQFDCSQTGAGQFGECIFAQPAAGSWYIDVSRFSGEGPYQATATLFGAAAPGAVVDVDVSSAVQTVQRGGVLPYQVVLENLTDVAQTVRVTITVSHSTGSPSAQLVSATVQLAPVEFFVRNIDQAVPGGAPLGDYRLTVAVTDLMGLPLGEASFPFTIQPSGAPIATP